LAYLANAYAAARGEYFTLVAAGDCLDRTFAERHLYMHRYASLCMVTSSDFRLTGARGELVHEACLWSTGICRGTSILRPFERSLDQWSFSPRSANVFRRWPAIDCFFASLREVGNETTDGWGEWLLLYFAQALGGSCRWGECLSTLAVEPGDNLQGIARGLPLFGRYPGATTERARAFLFALLCAFHRQLLPTLGRAGVQGFVRWLAAEAAPPARAGMRSRAMTAGMGAEVLTLLGDGP
jgi:hypothetical protein